MPIENELLLTKASWYRDFLETITIKDGETTRKIFNLTPKQGNLSVIPKRDGQKFDLFVGEESFEGITRKTITLREGEHDVKIKEFGYLLESSQ